MNQSSAGNARAASSPFDRAVADDVLALIAEFPLAWVMPAAGDLGDASLLPLLANTADGKLTGLLGHLARANPLARALSDDPRVEILFNGPHGYISPRQVTRPAWAPTWNYAQLRIRGEVTFDPGLTDEALERLVTAMESGTAHPWRIDEMGERYNRLTGAIIAFTVRITEVRGRFKLGQDEEVETLREILATLDDPALARWMRRANAARLSDGETRSGS